MNKFTKFLSDESGAVTIDWVALTAGILLLGIAVVYAIFNGGVNPLIASVNSNLATAVSVNIGTPPNPNSQPTTTN
ncbi:MAG: hypothetical protein AB8B85_21850 [Paracoccaceae bacterium]